MAGTQLLLINPPKKGKGQKMASRTKASRSAAAKKAAATRKRNASKRSAAAKKAAATRKRNAKKGAKRTAAKRSTKASRSAAAKKAAATRKRNASKRSAAAKKAAATRKRNARKSPAKRKSSKRGTAASRSRAAKKAAATRKRNAAKRSRAAKKAAATRKRKGRRSSVKSKSRPTASKRRAAAKKAAATRKRNAAKRSRAAKKAAATRKRNSRGKRKPARRSRRKASNAPATMKMGKTLTDAFMAPFNSIPSLATTAAVAAAVGGLYMVVKPRAWDAFGLTGQGGYINQAAQMLPVLPANVKDDLGNLGNKLLDAGTIAGLTYVLSSKKALNILDPKIGTFVAVLAGLNSVEQFLSEAQTLNIGGAYSNLKAGDFGNVFNQLGAPTTTSPTYGTLGAAHPMGMMHGAHNNMGMMHGAHNMGMMHGAHNYSMGMAKAPGKQGFFGAHNGAVPMGNNTIMNTAATRGTHAGNAIFGSKGMGRVNLF